MRERFRTDNIVFLGTQDLEDLIDGFVGDVFVARIASEIKVSELVAYLMITKTVTYTK